MNALDIHNLQMLATGIYVGGALVTFLFGEKPLADTQNKAAFAVVLIGLMLTWPISIWFVIGGKPKAKSGPWNS